MRRKHHSSFRAAGIGALLAIALPAPVGADLAGDTPRPYPVEHEMFGLRLPREGDHRHFGSVGVTGLELRFHPGRLLTVERTLPGSPAAGKFEPGDVVLGVNGIALEGTNPFIVLGASLTDAEAGDGRLVFDVRDAGGQTRAVTVEIPAFGAYSETWPLDCAKSEIIIAQAAEFYADRRTYAHGGMDDELRPESLRSDGVGGALAALFLLSTGDDQYLPRVKEHVDQLAADIRSIGDNTWDNGYNGILVAEYYLRTGDPTALPVLQYYVDDARDRQFYGVGWGHWGRSVSPRYVAGGLMNPAGAQLVTTLLLGKECGVEVDDDTLLGALRFWYRFAGRGSVPYGDHRGEGGLGSNGKDGMAAAMMQVAAGAQGDVGIYRQARDHLGMATLISYPSLVAGHGDDGRGDGIWRGIASSYHLETSPAEYHAVMNRLRWWFDLSRRPAGGLGMAMNIRFDDVGSGAGLALAYTAPRRTLRITGAPRSEHARPFALPERLWGREADRAFQSVDHGEPYRAQGEEEPVHVPFRMFGSAYAESGVDLNALERSEIVRNVHHKSFVIRAQAAKALLRIGALDDLATLLDDPDPRVRRAGLDGLTDYRYWHYFGRNPVGPEQLSPAMIGSIQRMLADPEEALFVVDGALMVLSRAAAGVIQENLSLVMPWTTHEEWWIRQSAFAALNGVARDDALLPQVLPTLVAMLNNEGRTQARAGMQHALAAILKRHPANSPQGGVALAGLLQAVVGTPILPEPRSGEGRYYVVQAALTALQEAPSKALAVAEALQRRFQQLTPNDIEEVAKRLVQVRGELPDDDREALTTRLVGDYRGALLQVLERNESSAPLDTILELTQLAAPDAGWQVLGGMDPAERRWQFASFAPAPEDELPAYVGKRFRDAALPERLEGWYRPDYDAAGWETGRAPVGKGVFRGRGRDGVVIENRSTWGDGEFIVVRGSFDLDPRDYDYFRLRVLANQGFRVYLNGHVIHTYVWWNNNPTYRPIRIAPNDTGHFRTGANHLAIYANAAYADGQQVGQIDVTLEGLKKSDLTGAAE